MPGALFRSAATGLLPHLGMLVHRMPTISRAIAVVTTTSGLPVAARRRYRAHKRSCAFQAISRKPRHRPPRLPPSTRWMASSSAAACNDTGTRSSSSPECHRAHGVGRQAAPCHCRQLRHPHPPKGQSAPALYLRLHAKIRLPEVNACRRRVLLQAHPPARHRSEDAAPNAFGPPSTVTSGSTMMTPNPSSGPNPPAPSSPSPADCLYLPFDPVH